MLACSDDGKSEDMDEGGNGSEDEGDGSDGESERRRHRMPARRSIPGVELAPCL